MGNSDKNAWVNRDIIQLTKKNTKINKILFYFHQTVVTGGNARSWSSWWLEANAGGDTGARELGGEEGWVLEPTAAELVALHVGAAFLELRAHDNVTVILRTRVPQVIVTIFFISACECLIDRYYCFPFCFLWLIEIRFWQKNRAFTNFFCSYRISIHTLGDPRGRVESTFT